MYPSTCACTGQFTLMLVFLGSGMFYTVVITFDPLYMHIRVLCVCMYVHIHLLTSQLPPSQKPSHCFFLDQAFPYSEGGYFKAHLLFPKEYPQRPPKMKFITDIWHPNGKALTNTTTGACTEYDMLCLCTVSILLLSGFSPNA